MLGKQQEQGMVRGNLHEMYILAEPLMQGVYFAELDGFFFQYISAVFVNSFRVFPLTFPDLRASQMIGSSKDPPPITARRPGYFSAKSNRRSIRVWSRSCDGGDMMIAAGMFYLSISAIIF
jgi:hypothetical protein